MVGLCDSAIEKAEQIVSILNCYLLKSASHPVTRWIVTAVFAIIYGIRVFYFLDGFYVVTYYLVGSILALLTHFFKPAVLPEADPESSMLPIKDSDEFKPFIRQLPELKLWLAVNLLIIVAFLITLFPEFDPSFTRVDAIVSSIILFIFFMTSSIIHMKKYKYIPFTVGKKKYGGNKHAAAPSVSCAD